MTTGKDDAAGSGERGSSAFFGADVETGDMHAGGHEVVSRPIAMHAGIPERIGRYGIKRRIGGGGMGVVYEAVQDNPRKTVAVKVMRQGLHSRSALRRFEYEAQLMARLRHPGIAQVYEAGTCSIDGAETPFFAMEYVPNARTLCAYADEKKLDVRARLDLFAQVCDAVAHGHRRGIIHRDLKPANVLVDSEGRPKVIDFGVARATDSDLAVTTQQTNVGQLIGTLQYMSPEQCDGDPIDLDTRSDVYAMGVILYELLTGALPYDVSKAAIHEATRVIKEQAPARPSSLRRTLRGDAETIVLKALEKERRDRFQSASDLATDVRRLLHDEPLVFARPVSVLAQARKFAKRHRKGLMAAGVAMALLATAAGVSTASAVRANRALAETRAVSEFFLLDVLRVVDPDEPGAIRDDWVPFLDHIGTTADRELRDRPLLQARVFQRVAALFIGVGRLDRAGAYSDRALGAARSSPDATPADTASALWARGYVLARSRVASDREDAFAMFREGVRLARAHDLDPELLARLVQGEADMTAIVEGDAAGAVELLDRLEDELQGSTSLNPSTPAGIHLLRARLYRRYAEPPLDLIARELDDAEAELMKLPEDARGKMAWVLLNRAAWHRLRGTDSDEPVRMLEEAIALTREYRPEDLVSHVAAYVAYAQALGVQGRAEESLEAASAAVAVARVVHERGSEPAEVLSEPLRALGNAYLLAYAQGRRTGDEAARAFQESVGLEAKRSPDAAAELAMYWVGSALKSGDAGLTERAVACADRVLPQCDPAKRSGYERYLAPIRAKLASLKGESR